MTGWDIAATALLLANGAPVMTQTAEPLATYAVAPGPLDTALRLFARQSGAQILYPDALVAGRRTGGVNGALTAGAALTALLRDTGLEHRRTRANVFVLIDPSQRAEQTELDDVDLPDVVVTGSYFRGADSPSPVTVITQDDVARRGRSTVAETLAALPQNFTGGAYEGSAGTGADRSGRNLQFATGMNLRGLGADATLVLVNGRRIAGTGSAGDFADVSNLPSSAIARADVLLDGASALYGADAVGGVVNIILKQTFDGFESRARIGGTSDGGAGEVLLSQTGGLAWTGGHLIAAYEFHDRAELRAADRRATADADLRPLGGSDWRELYAAPGNIMFYDPVTGSFDPVFAIPRNQDGVGLSPGDFLPGVVNRSNQNQGRWSLPHQTRHSLFAAGRQALPGGFSVDGDVRYTERAYRLAAFADIGVLTVTDANPYFVSPDGESFQEIAYSYINDLGPGRDKGLSRSLGGALGLEGPVGDWTLAAYVSGGREENENTSANRANTALVSEALGTSPDNPATAFSPAADGYFNPYGDPAANSAAVLAFIGSGYTFTRNTSSVASINLKADGALFDLPGGPLRLAVGLDARRERFGTLGETFISTPLPRAVTPTLYQRDVSAVFLELRAPFVGAANARPGLERLELSVAARAERHQGVGDTTNPKVGLLYSPTSDLLLRASWGTSFRAPSLRELYSAYQLGPAFLSRGATNVISIIQYGGNPDLRPETAESVTAGFVWTPAALDGFRLEGGWFRTRFNDRIGQPVSENLAEALNDPSLAPFVRYVSPGSNPADLALIQSLLDEPGNYMPGIFPAAAYGAVVDSRYVNAAAVEVEGIDLSARFAFDLAQGRMLIDGTVTHLLTNDRRISDAAPTEDLLGAPNFPAGWRGRLGAARSRGAATFGLAVNHVSGGRDPLGGKAIGDWTTLDGQARLDLEDGWGENLSLTLNVLNLANTAPPFYDSPRGIGYDAANTNVLGRQLSLQLVKRW